MNENHKEYEQSNNLPNNIISGNTESLQSLIDGTLQETIWTEQLAEFSNTYNKQEYSSQLIEATTSLETTGKVPNTLCSLALAKLQEDSLRRTSQMISDNDPNKKQFHCGQDSKISASDLKTPDSLGAAPPSYSFVVRQSSQPRPRLMGTFIPSSSFVLHTPPPNYATAFDIYIDNPMPNPARTYHFGYMPMYVICPDCGYIGVTMVVTKIIMSTHLCALILCLLCCWACAPLPYVLRSCKEVHHYCRNCRVYLGMYNPNSLENTTNRT